MLLFFYAVEYDYQLYDPEEIISLAKDGYFSKFSPTQKKTAFIF